MKLKTLEGLKERFGFPNWVLELLQTDDEVDNRQFIRTFFYLKPSYNVGKIMEN